MLPRSRWTQRCRSVLAAWLACLFLSGGGPAFQAREASPRTSASPPSGAADLEEIYREALPSVLLVETETWTGPGILVDSSGLILIPFEPSEPGGYLAATVAPGRKVAARIVPVSGFHYGVVKVHPEAVAGLRPLALAGPPDREGFPATGDRLVAILWSPGSGYFRRSCTIQKVGNGSLSTDLPLPPSSEPAAAPSPCDRSRLQCSSGVVLDTRGRVVGLNLSQKLKGKRSTTIALLGKSGKLLSTALAQAANISPPAPAPLPVLPDAPYPEAALERLSRGIDPSLYRLVAGPFLVEFLTPPLVRAAGLGRAEAHIGSAKACSEPEGTANRWRPDFSDETPVVTVRVVPEIHRRAGTYLGVTAYWIFIPLIAIFALVTNSGVMLDNPPHISSRFDPAIREIEILRGGRRVEPIRPGRVCGTRSPYLDVDLCPPESPEREKRRVKGCYLVSAYPAEAFAPGEAMELRILPEEGSGTPTLLPLDEPLRQRIWADFEPYREMTQKR